jgi:DMSO/TMAO reductase YedYZ molybdopterin-dependent catalytic subunit
MKTTRRHFLSQSLCAAQASTLGRFAVGTSLQSGASLFQSEDFQEGRLLGELPFLEEDDVAVGEILGSGLSGRLAVDLAQLTTQSLITPNDQFFIRTRSPDRLDPGTPWKIRVHGRVREAVELTLPELLAWVEPMGEHLLECSGNGRRRHFGLISAARWSGIPIHRVLERASVLSDSDQVLISGFDEHSRTDSGSVAGASWIFSRKQLEGAGAFLATEMNGEVLPRDHGYPVRLMIPGWYGCACIKWVQEIELVPESTPATEPMQEYAGRTQQEGNPQLARDFQPASIDLTALPVPVEKWKVRGAIRYRVVGILWAGEKSTDALQIRFNPDMKYISVDEYRQFAHSTWTLWSHPWRPNSMGRYQIQLRVDDSSIRTRRLDRGYYNRQVEITEL